MEACAYVGCCDQFDVWEKVCAYQRSVKLSSLPPSPLRLTFSCALLSLFWTFFANIPVLISAMAASPEQG